MEEMNPAWLSMVTLHSSREFTCEDMTEEQCSWYKQRWHFWYIADYVFALPTVAFFMCTIGVFILSHLLLSHVLGYRRFRGPPIWRKLMAVMRYLSYRGFRVESLSWSSAPIGVLLLGLVGTVFFFCMDLAPQPYYWPSDIYGGSPPIATRSGWMALACMPFVFATASKTNWITLLTGISHEKLQVFHRWIAYAFFVLALIHTFPFIVWHIRVGDMESHFASSLVFYWTGIVALIFQAWLTFMSHSKIRSLFGYEFFKATHFFAIVIFIVVFFWHCYYTLSSWDYFIATAAVYIPCYAYPWFRTIFEHGLTKRAHLSVETNGFTRIAIPVTSTWTPGQHCFLRFTSFGLSAALSSHPFTICSSPSIESGVPSQLVFYIRHQRGFTAKLYEYALANPDASVPVQIDGPYGGVNLQRFRDSDRLLVVAGGSGAGWILPLIERFLRRGLLNENLSKQQNSEPAIDAEDTVPAVEKSSTVHNSPGPLSLRVVLATRDAPSRSWFLSAVSELSSKYPSADMHVQVNLTGQAAKEIHPDSAHDGSQRNNSSSDEIEVSPNKGNQHAPAVLDQEVEGRPRLAAIIAEEAARAAEAAEELGVFVCGPQSMQDDVRNGVAAENLRILGGNGGRGVYLHCEHFSWA